MNRFTPFKLCQLKFLGKKKIALVVIDKIYKDSERVKVKGCEGAQIYHLKF